MGHLVSFFPGFEEPYVNTLLMQLAIFLGNQPS
jgi:hypothetical protein